MRYQVTAPVADYSGDVAGVQFSRGTATFDTEQSGGSAALSYFQRRGYRLEEETDGQPDADPSPVGDDASFDPAKRSVEDVVTYLDGAGEAEAERVLDAEAAGKNRKTLADQRDDILARERALNPKEPSA